MRKAFSIFAALAILAGCSRDSDVEIVPIPPESRPEAHRTHEPRPRSAPELPTGHPPIGGMADAAPAGGMPAAPAAEESDGHPDLPLRKNGLNSAAELARALASSGSEEARRHLEAGFRRAFTTRREARDYRIAEEELRKAIEIDPTYAEAYRALAYAVFNTGLDFDGAIKLYEQAVSLKPDYGEAHYALAFMLGGRDPKTGREHFEKAMALGVKDERGLREKFYAGQ